MTGMLGISYQNYNYGAVLQTYALYRTLSDIGLDPVRIAYRPHGRIRVPKMLSEDSGLDRKWVRRRNAVISEIDRFYEVIPRTAEYTDRSIHRSADAFDVIICGSDQVWNPALNRGTFFVPFAGMEKKISYAASCGSADILRVKLCEIAAACRTFKAVSVREASLRRRLMAIDPGLDISVMPDPAFLLSKDEWEDVCDGYDVPGSYILAYILSPSVSIYEKIAGCAMAAGCAPLFVCPVYPVREGRLHLSETYRWEAEHPGLMADDVGVERFLSLVKNASLVITDSFHGSVFSLIFGVSFVTLPRGGEWAGQDRIKDLMDSFGMDRIRTDLADEDYGFADDEAMRIKEKCSQLRTEGRKFLTEDTKDWRSA